MKRIIDWIDRECKTCNIVFKSTDRNKLGLCPKCRMNRLNRKTEEELKKPYPLDKNAKKKRYNKILRDLDKTETKEERREIYFRELNYMISSGIWEWCIDLRNTPKRIGKSNKKGRRPKEQTDIKLKHPNTKDWYD